MYKKASKLRLRIATPQGSLTVEQLWDLPVTELDVLAVKLQEEYKESGKKSFLDKKSPKDAIAKLTFDIVLNILETKVEDAEKASKTLENKDHNQKILAIIASKEDGELQGKSIKELEKMLID